MTRKQKPGEYLQELLQTSQILSKNCKFRDVYAEEYRQELVRYAFVNGLASYHIRQRLLKNTDFTVDRAYTTAMSFHMTQELSAVYYSETRVTATVSPSDKPTASATQPAMPCRAHAGPARVVRTGPVPIWPRVL